MSRGLGSEVSGEPIFDSIAFNWYLFRHLNDSP